MPLIRIPKPPKYVLSDGITQSMLSTFLTCRHKSRLQLDGWESINANTSAFERGNYIHELLEYWYKDTNNRSDDAYIAKWLDDFESQWVAKNHHSIFSQEDLNDTIANAYALFPKYLKFWSVSDAKYRWEFLEKVFDVSWKGYRLRGKFDGVLWQGGAVWLFETKTKAQIEEDYLVDLLGFNFQNLYYLTALKAMGYEPRGVIYNIIRKPQLRIKKTEDKSEFILRIDADIRKRPEHYFKRFEIAYDPQTINRFVSELKYKLDDFAGWIVGSNPTYKNESACDGKLRCPFIKTCSSGNMVGYRQTRILFRELLG